MSVNEKMTVIADAIRDKTGDTDLLNLDQIAEKIPEVYCIGVMTGEQPFIEANKALGKTLVGNSNKSINENVDSIEQINAQLEQVLYGTSNGGKSPYDEFWDNFQQNGNLTDYRYAFGGAGWSAKNFKPKYPLQPKQATYMFSHFDRDGLDKENGHIDLSQFNIDFSKCTSLTNAFYNAHIDNTGFVDCSACTSLSYTFACNSNGMLNKIHLKVVETNTFSSTFAYAGRTTELIFTDDSVIASNGLNLQWSKSLTKESLVSVINALSPTIEGLTVVLSKTAKENNFTDEEWATLISTKSNWTISLV